MKLVRSGVRPEEVRQAAQHILYVEGRDNESVDPSVLKVLFEDKIKIAPLGPSFSVKSVAEALHAHHPTYYFLIDRDHYGQDYVEDCWKNFPNIETSNLLIWRRREIENYFLDPSYLYRSKFCAVTQDILKEKILYFTQKRLFLDVSNCVIISLREELKRTWVEKFSNPDVFSTSDAALKKLKELKELKLYSEKVSKKISCCEIEQEFHQILNEMTGGKEILEFNSGTWLEKVQGKKILSQLVNSSCFKVKSTEGKDLMGREKLNEIVKELLRQDLKHQPSDFVELKGLIDKRVESEIRQLT